MNSVTPCAAIEGGNIRPQRRASQAFLLIARRQIFGAVSFPLTQTDDASRRQSDSESKVKAADACAQGEDVEGEISHMNLPGPCPYRSSDQKA
jgi:hypothetical protein